MRRDRWACRGAKVESERLKRSFKRCRGGTNQRVVQTSGEPSSAIGFRCNGERGFADLRHG